MTPEKQQIIDVELENSAQCFGGWVCEHYPLSERQKVAAVYALFEPMLRRRYKNEIDYLEDGEEKVWITSDNYDNLKYLIFLGCKRPADIRPQHFDLLIQRLSYYYFRWHDSFEVGKLRYMRFEEWLAYAGIKLKITIE